MTTTPDSPKNKSGLTQMIVMGKSILHKLYGLLGFQFFKLLSLTWRSFL